MKFATIILGFVVILLVLGVECGKSSTSDEEIGEQLSVQGRPSKIKGQNTNGLKPKGVGKKSTPYGKKGKPVTVNPKGLSPSGKMGHRRSGNSKTKGMDPDGTRCSMIGKNTTRNNQICECQKVPRGLSPKARVTLQWKCKPVQKEDDPGNEPGEEQEEQD